MSSLNKLAWRKNLRGIPRFVIILLWYRGNDALQLILPSWNLFKDSIWTTVIGRVRLPLPSSVHISNMPQHQAKLPGLGRKNISQVGWDSRRLGISLERISPLSLSSVLFMEFVAQSCCSPCLFPKTLHSRFCLSKTSVRDQVKYRHDRHPVLALLGIHYPRYRALTIFFLPPAVRYSHPDHKSFTWIFCYHKFCMWRENFSSFQLSNQITTYSATLNFKLDAWNRKKLLQIHKIQSIKYVTIS